MFDILISLLSYVLDILLGPRKSGTSGVSFLWFRYLAYVLYVTVGARKLETHVSDYSFIACSRLHA